MSTTAIILAAGEGKRMKSEKSKLLHEVCGKSLIQCVYDAAAAAGAESCVMVVGHRAGQVKEAMGEDKLYALQEQQLGTGHAVMQAMPQVEKAGYVFVLAGDVPLIKPETLQAALQYHKDNFCAVTVITAELDNPFGYGRVIRSADGDVVKIVEQKDASEAEKAVKEINSGLYCFNASLLDVALSELKNDNAQGEYYLTDTIEILLKKGHKAGAYQTADRNEINGVNDRVQLAQAGFIMQKRILEKLMYAGVTVVDPNNTYIQDSVTIGQDTIVHPGCIIEGNTVIGANCVIGASCTLADVTVGDNTDITNTVAKKAKIGADCHVGPFAYLRPGTELADNVKIGDFVEVKNSILGTGTKVSHLTYIGDSDIGKNINFGCGCVTVNYDGKKKCRTVVEDGAFIGCNTNLVAPVTVGEGAYIAAGSTITKDIPKDALGIARCKQENKENWSKRKREGK